MSWKVQNLRNLTLVGTSAGSPTIGIGGFDDAESITIFMTSSHAGTSTGAGTLGAQVSQFDPNELNTPGSTEWKTLSSTIFSSGVVLSTLGFAITITNISFRGLRLTGYTSGVTGEIIANASKSIFV